MLILVKYYSTGSFMRFIYIFIKIKHYKEGCKFRSCGTPFLDEVREYNGHFKQVCLVHQTFESFKLIMLHTFSSSFLTSVSMHVVQHLGKGFSYSKLWFLNDYCKIRDKPISQYTFSSVNNVVLTKSFLRIVGFPELNKLTASADFDAPGE